MNELTVNNGKVVVEETEKYIVYKTAEGKFLREMKYDRFWSKVPETQEDMLRMYQVMNEDEAEGVNTMSTNVGAKFQVEQIYFEPYNSFDEETGESRSGVTSTIETPEGEFFVTSSKSVYHTLNRIMQTFGTPNTDTYRNPVIVEITGQKGMNGTIIDVKLAGFAK